MKNLVTAAISKRKSEITLNIPEENCDIDEDETNQWQQYHENILIDWGDKALCYRWLHAKSCSKYIFLRNLYTIPVIIMSTLTGTANFAIERIPIDYQGYVQVGIGSINILAGIITTLSQFLKINELSEAHRVSSISWDKFYRNIKLELVKAPSDRTDVTYIIKTAKDEYDRLMETSPNIDPGIIKKFNKTFNFNNKIECKKESLLTLNKPEILDKLESTKNFVYKSNNNIKKNKIDKLKIEKKNKEKIIEELVTTFVKDLQRPPTITELKNNIGNKVSEEIIQNYLTGKHWLNINN